VRGLRPKCHTAAKGSFKRKEQKHTHTHTVWSLMPNSSTMDAIWQNRSKVPSAKKKKKAVNRTFRALSVGKIKTNEKRDRSRLDHTY
jgi:hypothetical protein